MNHRGQLDFETRGHDPSIGRHYFRGSSFPHPAEEPELQPNGCRASISNHQVLDQRGGTALVKFGSLPHVFRMEIPCCAILPDPHGKDAQGKVLVQETKHFGLDVREDSSRTHS